MLCLARMEILLCAALHESAAEAQAIVAAVRARHDEIRQQIRVTREAIVDSLALLVRTNELFWRGRSLPRLLFEAAWSDASHPGTRKKEGAPTREGAWIPVCWPSRRRS